MLRHVGDIAASRALQKKPSSYYLRTCRSMVNYSRIIGGATRMMKNLSVIISPFGRVPEKASRLDLVVLELAAVETLISRLP